MSRASEDPYATETRASTEEPSGDSAFTESGTTINLNVLRQPQGIGVGTAVALTIGASVATVLYMRRRARARMRRQLAWLAIRMVLARALSGRGAKGAATFGGLGGGLLAAAMVGNRLRQSRSDAGIEELRERLAALQAQVDARHAKDRPEPRDVVLGAALGLGLAGLIGRAASRRKSS
jgi:hypothetical protein